MFGLSLSADGIGTVAAAAAAVSPKTEIHQQARLSKPAHGLANHGLLPNEDDVREL
eukprot:CAMPEP_0184323552 /NCGR_PEP_ID=MMETSP1049-20130417/130919_1 /TAXON_ID=77928 /ORGANISM="Proteomonas sulcata, Strain CCMP704" /LENGTH=55 /DNA_ID=CAMNT_0026645097 /DNA_START=122 /DNA_END=286 /DNA_ORIENTATION=-